MVLVVFSTLIFILLIKFGKNLSKVDIDEEYSNKDKFIKETISKLFATSNIKNKPEISFTRIGKLSAAHKLCWSIHRKKLKNKAVVITCEDILKLWRL
ncbi:MAG: hypothetical protein UR29_C0013G0024 [Candidatus Woesebacteria bacterium GW2011_GWC2_33_12]|uniref:Uncharacterized protein n=1 Tax=Candidatus Woesebacteria bacterium GW2011_GWB1_33_22 TaxID=1618566 RepID=A0A0F9ZJ78_9BACT|nr:MAG: hypothetical protein UR29_C0013G0024 [Candidatus Woesebacteria bacterium GW2011_GWC2_33_12]KKP41710.1 MAG: hypothetical protein UR33_C0011G0025 [Candidatus Woesebacteria bacterium GW2011_GWA2_33_20]KKP44154.1 MAG: hypothetical protein UR35_C0011G0040 [Candidatus Woesebacteria bacterium GW2011_GWB1_33_22]KKP45813.1 MAG: hypothetical protein UR37_C0014G0040 [Microgenomates group bacterium GW2011_GWC1_33_28]KKP50235.1 MAG: hypothetical protein UR41_C0010G0039 [Candidatus Woesebacteria bact